MTIQIELKDIEALKSEISMLKKDNYQLEEKLKSLNEKELKKQAVDLARTLFGDVMGRVFDELGFVDKITACDIDFGQLEHYLGKRWWDSEKLNIELGATITNQFRGAFLKLGIKSEMEEQSK